MTLTMPEIPVPYKPDGEDSKEYQVVLFFTEEEKYAAQSKVFKAAETMKGIREYPSGVTGVLTMEVGSQGLPEDQGVIAISTTEDDAVKTAQEMINLIVRTSSLSKSPWVND